MMHTTIITMQRRKYIRYRRNRSSQTQKTGCATNDDDLDVLHTTDLREVVSEVLITLAADGVSADLLVILLDSSKILTGLGELTFLHTLTHIPVHEGTLGVHEIELVVKTGPGLGNSRRVRQHAHGALHLGEITTGHNSRGLVVDTHLETGRAPVHKLNGTLGLDVSDSHVDILGHHITTVQEAASHVLTVTRVTLHHHVSGLEHSVRNLAHSQLLVVSLLSRHDRGIARQREVNTRVGHEVRLELSKIDVQSTIETQGRGNGRNDLSDQTVQVRVRRALDVQVTAADIVDSLVIHHERTVGVLQHSMRGQNRVVRLHNSRRHLRGGEDAELKLGLLTVVHGQTLHEEGTETGTRTTTEGVEHHETLETSTVIGELTDAVEHKVDDLLTDGVVTTSVVVRGILLTSDELLRVEQLLVGTGADLIDYGRLEIDEHGTGYVLTGTSLAEEGVESIIAATDGLVRGHLPVGADTMLEAVQLPASVTDLDTGLTDVDATNETREEQ